MGGPNVARAQLAHIAQVSESDHIRVRVIPFAVDDFAGGGYSMLYAAGPVPQLDTVQLDVPHGGIFIDAEPQLRRYRKLYNRIADSALATTASRDLIHRIARNL